MRAVPRFCEFYPGICLTTEEKARKTLVRVRKTPVTVQYTYYQKHPHITKPSQTHTLQNPLIHTTKQCKITTVQIKPPQYIVGTLQEDMRTFVISC